MCLLLEIHMLLRQLYMVQVGTRIRTCDNSGASLCKCIKITGNRAANGKAYIGDHLVVSVIRARSDKRIKKHSIQTGVLVRSTNRSIRRNGFIFFNKRNALLILDKKNKPVGTRVFGAVTHELRFKRCIKVISMAASIL
jgi:large subunit ribosomal protein L14